MVKGESGVNIVDVVQEVEEVQVIFLRNASPVVTESTKEKFNS
jgi:hypothetical protein